MLRDNETSAVMAATRDFVVGLIFGDAEMSEETARKFGDAHGLGDPAAGRLIFSLAAFVLDRRGEDLVAFQAEMSAALASLRGKPEGALQ